MGSFVSATAWRLPRSISLWDPSSCDQCRKKIAAWRNIPVLTWCLQRGQASCCQTRIPASVVIVELAGTGVGLACGLLFGMLGIIVLGVVTILGGGLGWLYFMIRQAHSG